MNCDQAQILLHALLDRELDAGNAREVEAHVASCPRCAAALRDFRDMHRAMASETLQFPASRALRARIEGALPGTVSPSRRTMLAGFAAGAGLSALAASGLMLMVLRANEEQRILGELVTAHVRSLQGEHLTDVVSTDRHTVKPWFNGRLDVAPPVLDLTARGFTLLGGRLDALDGKAVAAIVYRRRNHVINVFVTTAGNETPPVAAERVQGFNVRRWTGQGLALSAISDLNPDELQEFMESFEAARRDSGG